MSLKDKIKQAQIEAVSQVAKQELEAQRKSVFELNEIFGKSHDLEAILTEGNDEQVLILPIHMLNRVILEEELIKSLKVSLKGFYPKVRNCGGYVAFRVSTTHKKFPQSLDFYVEGLHFKLGIIKGNIELENLRLTHNKKERKYFKQKQYENLPASQWYSPPV